MAPTAAIFGLDGPVISPEEAAFFQDADPWGFILFDRNVETPDQVRALTASLRDLVGRDVPILIDQEGGRVQRMWPPHWRSYRPALVDAQAAKDLSRVFWLRGRLIAQELLDVGVDVNCAPLGDIAQEDTTDRVQNRCYGFDADVVIDAARAVIAGQSAGGVLSVIKHMPGHGRARVDSHLEVPKVDASLEDLEAHDFAVFRALRDAPMGMTAHLAFDALDPGEPVTTSPKGIRYLRETLGFDGLLMTDDLEMEALKGTPAQRAARARAAGVDLILHCNGSLTQMKEVARAAGLMDPAALARAARALGTRTPPAPFDVRSALAELERLTDTTV